MLVQVLVGSRRVHESTLLYAGSHVLTVNSRTVPLSSGHLQLRCHTRRAQLIHDTVTVTYVHTDHTHTLTTDHTRRDVLYAMPLTLLGVDL